MPQLDFMMYTNTMTWILLFMFISMFMCNCVKKVWVNVLFYKNMLKNQSRQIINTNSNNLSTPLAIDLLFMIKFIMDMILTMTNRRMIKEPETKTKNMDSADMEYNTIYEIVDFKNLIGIPNTPEPLVGFAYPGSSDMAVIMCIHNDFYYFLQVVLVIVLWFMFFSVYKNMYTIQFGSGPVNKPLFLTANKYGAIIDSCSFLEVTWTIIPAAILLLIGFPGVSLLYGLDEHVDADFWVKMIGHQWYWTYEYPMFENREGRWLAYDSSLADMDPVLAGAKFSTSDQSFLDNPSPNQELLDLTNNRIKAMNENPNFSTRYMTVDSPLIVPSHLRIQAVMSSSDVMHSWAVPALGIKMDACPGSLNKISFQSDFDTRNAYFNISETQYDLFDGWSYNFGYWGQCSEFCGVGHGFMPIVIHTVPLKDYFFVLDQYMYHQQIKYLHTLNHMSDSELETHQYMYPSLEEYSEFQYGWYSYHVWLYMLNACGEIDGYPLGYREKYPGNYHPGLL